MKHSQVLRTLSLSVLLCAGAVTAPAHAQLNVTISVQPPALQYEVVPVMQPDHVWASGYWGWSGERHVWVRGRPIMQREGYRWDPDGWEHRDGQYFRKAGHWERDHSHSHYKEKKEKKNKKYKKDKGHGNGHGKHKD